MVLRGITGRIIMSSIVATDGGYNWGLLSFYGANL